jgi:HEAT repeat protein
MRHLSYTLILICATHTWANVDTFVNNLASEDAETRFGASEGAAAYGYDAIPRVATLLDHDDYYVVQAARRALELICAKVPAGAPAAHTRSVNLAHALAQARTNEARRWLAWLLSYAGDRHAAPHLLAMLDDDPVFDYALFALEGIGANPAGPPPTHSEIAAALMRRVHHTTGDKRAALLNAVAAMGDATLLPALMAEARKPVPECDPAVAALGRLGGVPAANLVWERYKDGCQPGLDAYLAIAERAKPKVAQGMYLYILHDSTEPHVHAAALRGLAQHGGRAMVDFLAPYLASERSDVRGSAAKALEELNGRWVTRRMRNHLGKAGPPARSALLRVIAARDGKRARDVLEKALNDQSPEVRVTALALLGREPDLKYEQTFLDAAHSGSPDARPAALRAYLSLADSVLRAGDDNRALAMYSRALDLAIDNRQRLAAIEGIAQIGMPESLPVLINAAAAPGLELPAGLAALGIVEQLAPREPDRARDAALTLLDQMPPREVAKRAGRQLHAMGTPVDPHHRYGFVLNWAIIGPFPAISFETVYPPEVEFQPNAVYDGAADQKVTWKPLRIEDVQGIVDLPERMAPNEDVIAYARAEVRVDQDHDLLIKLGSDDGVIMWLNGEKIHSNDASRRVTIDNDIVPARLQAGTNILLLKIVQGGAGWGYTLRLTDTNGNPIPFRNR